MAIEGVPPTHRFVTTYTKEYPAETIFTSLATPPPRTVSARCTPAFHASRHREMTSFIEGGSTHQMTEGLFAEELVRFSLNSALRMTGFEAKLAPQSLERSTPTHKGVDLLITDPSNTLYLGIDAKLRQGKSCMNRDGYGWNAEILTPYIYLSLGNWQAQMREGNLSMLAWMRGHAVRGVGDSQSIPGFSGLKQYVIARIERSLAGCCERVTDGRTSPIFGVPIQPDERSISEEKLHLMQSLFAELVMSG